MKVQSFSNTQYATFKTAKNNKSQQIQSNPIESNINFQLYAPSYINFKGNQRVIVGPCASKIATYDKQIARLTQEKSTLVALANQKKQDGTFLYNDDEMNQIASYIDCSLDYASYLHEEDYEEDLRAYLSFLAMKDKDGNRRFSPSDTEILMDAYMIAQYHSEDLKNKLTSLLESKEEFSAQEILEII